MIQRKMIQRAMRMAVKRGFDPRNSHGVMAKSYEWLLRMQRARPLRTAA